MQLSRARLALVVVALVAACADKVALPDCECQTTPPSCEGCPPVADTLCVDSACVDRAADDASVIADVSIARGLDGVVDVTIAVVDARGLGCAELGPLTEASNVLSGDRVDVTGGPFHPDIRFGTVPTGAVLVAADGLDVDGNVVGRGCVAVDVVAGDNDVGVVTVAP